MAITRLSVSDAGSESHAFFFAHRSRLMRLPSIGAEERSICTTKNLQPVTAKNSIVYFISMTYIDHTVWRRHREEAKRGPPFGHRITRNEGAMRSLLLPYATPGLSRIAGGYLSAAPPRGQPWTPVWRLPHGREGLRVRRTTGLCPFRRPFMRRPAPRQLTRSALLDLTPIVPATAYHRRSYAERYSRCKRARWVLHGEGVRVTGSSTSSSFCLLPL
jgi:hypothetical protein